MEARCELERPEEAYRGHPAVSRSCPVPPNEDARLAALRSYAVLDTEPEPAFDDLTRLAALFTSTPIALISLVDEHRLWFKARQGLDVHEVPRVGSLCSYAVLQSADPQPLIVPDALADPRFAHTPLVQAAPYVRFYAGAPLVLPGNLVLGMLCVIDQKPRELQPAQVQALVMLARQVVDQLEHRLAARRHALLNQELERAHAAMAESREQLAAFIQAEPECVKIVGADGTLLQINPAGLEMIEAESSEQVLGASVFPIIAPEYREAFEQFHQLICAGERGFLTFEIVGLKGTRRCMETHASPLRYGPSGEIAHLAVTRDVTVMKRARQAELREIEERRSAEHALRRSNERYQAVLRATQDVVWDWDWQRETIIWSERLEPMLGHSLPGLLAKPAWKEEQIHPGDRERVGASLREALARRAALWAEEYRFRRGDGTYAQVLDRAAVSYDSTGRPTRLVGAISDVTRQRELQAQLSLAERMATVGTLAAGVAHEINNPLSYVLSNLRFSLDTLAPLTTTGESEDLSEVHGALQDAVEGAQRMQVIVSELKTFSRGDEENICPVDVHKPLESALRMAANDIHRRARLRRDHANLPLARANESRLAQVFLNLLVNAVQALPDRAPEQNEIRVVTRKLGDAQVMIEFSDTGVGIPPHLRARIFEPFFTTKPVGEGTGLGLSVCHRLITQMKGSIEVDSEPGQGATFRVILPVA
ncbi:ATP-binding protein [Vitiosangium sp. GDMCC 1.1324]|uniref:ATP-binding protein n=1 Tax=Vitiosangium sp. (strain GDMCC 1.1324) TaxID=2138576 RepID=UPI000D3623D1|nr:ATP-binding protein [Vitiosangium sp. GDMCC 1.1324]PTL78915.1 hypothetical protein DAT35_35390 [Vitiosangium sp. GDMCC 1.1324]